ncbi:hypothetical protein GCM10022393_06090 [Aquimarina addita]|uniref:Putative auto-transporter adhesin head GIN domain-containing protein n=1 Tax=Aquimarina addita TaxID=870485 RepID=A0ABP7XAJ0_9FLAO
MGKRILVFLIFFTVVMQAQDVIKKTVGDFNEVKVFDKIEVILRKSSENKVEISGMSRDEVDIVNNDNVLKVKMSLDNLWDDDNTVVTVYYTDISKIDVNEGAKIIAKDVVTSDKLDLRAQEGGDIIAKIETTKLAAKAVTGGKLTLDGKAIEQEVTVTAGGQYLAEDLKTKSTMVKITAGGRANISASEYVKANATAGGTIKIYGHPKEIDTKKVFGGKIIEVN